MKEHLHPILATKYNQQRCPDDYSVWQWLCSALCRSPNQNHYLSLSFILFLTKLLTLFLLRSFVSFQFSTEILRSAITCLQYPKQCSWLRLSSTPKLYAAATGGVPASNMPPGARRTTIFAQESHCSQQRRCVETNSFTKCVRIIAFHFGLFFSFFFGLSAKWWSKRIHMCGTTLF